MKAVGLILANPWLFPLDVVFHEAPQVMAIFSPRPHKAGVSGPITVHHCFQAFIPLSFPALSGYMVLMCHQGHDVPCTIRVHDDTPLHPFYSYHTNISLHLTTDSLCHPLLLLCQHSKRPQHHPCNAFNILAPLSLTNSSLSSTHLILPFP